MGIAAWIAGSVVCLAAIAGDDPQQKTMARPEPPMPPDETTAVVEGKLGLWHAAFGQIRVADGVISFPEGKGGIVCEHAQKDFVLSLSWNSGESGPGNAGILFHGIDKGNDFGGAAIVLEKGMEGTLRSESYLARRNLAKPGDWNSLRFEAQGNSLRLQINDQDVWKIMRPGKAGVLAIFADIPAGGKLWLRDVVVTETGFRPLFNGKDLEGWTGGGGKAEDCWKIEGGLLQCTGAKGPWLKSTEEFGDFNLRLEYRLPPAGNSGVYVRVPPDGNHHGPGSGVEIQVLDDAHPSYAKLQKYQYTGSVYAVAPATRNVARAAGEWNSLEINCKGQKYRVVHNGVVIVEADESNFPALKERRLQGFFGLQNHSSVVSFRNIRLGPAE